MSLVRIRSLPPFLYHDRHKQDLQAVHTDDRIRTTARGIMGTFSVAVEIGNPTGIEFVQVEALVDTGATYTVLSRDILVNLGIEAMESVSFELADERIVEYDVGEARIRLDGRERTTLVVFGPEAAQALLGATTLQLFNLAADPTRERLVPVPALLKQLMQGVKVPTARLESIEERQALP